MPSKDAAPVEELVHLLDRTERLLITFYYVERLTPSEIALVLNITPNRVLSMLRTVRRRISEALAGGSARSHAHRSSAESSAQARSAASLGNTASPV